MSKALELFQSENFSGVSYIRFESCGFIPNNLLPLLIYEAAYPDATAERMEHSAAANTFRPAWRDGVFSYHHYHSTAHEFLGCFAGSGKVLFGGECGLALRINRGDAVLIPAGVGHKFIDGSAEFSLVGAYPLGQYPDLCIGKEEELRKTADNIRNLSLPAGDPVYGKNGPVRELWYVNSGTESRGRDGY